jgi:hypothetical protein
MSEKQFACIDCKHAFNTMRVITPLARILKMDAGWKCGHPEALKAGRFDNVKGRTSKLDYEYCSIRRMYGEGCGPEAEQWMPLNRRDIFKLIQKGT